MGKHVWYGAVEGHGVVQIIFKDIQVVQTVRVRLTSASRKREGRGRSRKGSVTPDASTQPLPSTYRMARNFGGKIFWRIAENVSFGGIYFGG